MLSFIGVNVLKTDTGFMSSTYHKQTNTGLYTNFCSNLPETYKKGAFTVFFSYIFILYVVTGLSLLMSLLNCVKCLLTIVRYPT